MTDTLFNELLAVRLFEERMASGYTRALMVDAAESAGTRADKERSRKRRTRFVRILKALAMRLAPPMPDMASARRGTPAL